MEKINQIVRLLNNVAEICVDKPTPQRILAVAEVLMEYEIESLELAVREHKKTGKFFPAPVDIISLMSQPDNHPDEYWNQIMNHVKRFGAWSGTPKLPDHAQRALDNVGGYEAVCQCETDKIPILASQFRTACSAFIATQGRLSRGGLTIGEAKSFLGQLNAKSGINFLDDPDGEK